MPFDVSEHSTATAVGYYYSDHYTPEEFARRIERTLDMEIGLDAEPSHQPYRSGRELKITITIERTGR